jgi:methyl-accepting chemotaxis protein
VIEAIRRHGTTILQQHVETAAVEDALRGESNTAVIDDYRGIAVLSSYTPLEIEGVDWVLLSEIDAAEAFAPLRRFTRLVVATLVGVTLAIGLYSLFAARFFTRRIDSLMDGARSAGSGDLTARVAIDGRDEFGELGNVFN